MEDNDAATVRLLVADVGHDDGVFLGPDDDEPMVICR